MSAVGFHWRINGFRIYFQKDVTMTMLININIAINNNYFVVIIGVTDHNFTHFAFMILKVTPRFYKTFEKLKAMGYS